MNFEPFGGVNIYRPQVSSELLLREKAQKHLYSKYSIGEYRDKDRINEIIQYQFSFFFNELNNQIPVVAQSDFLHFVLFQYDQSVEVDQLFKDRRLNPEEDKKWADIGPIFRRTIKYLAERSVMLHEKKESGLTQNMLLQALDHLWICAEEAVAWYLLSDQTFAIFPDASILRILSPDNLTYIILDVAEPCDLSTDTRRDTQNRHQYIGQPIDNFIFNILEHDLAIGTAMQKEIGASYKEAAELLYKLIDSCVPLSTGFPIININKKVAIEKISAASGIPYSAVEKTIAGFTLTKENMLREGREVWKPKQEYRVYRRGFFEIEHKKGKYLCFSRGMARECLIQLFSEIVFKQIPVEWRSKDVLKAVEAISNRAGAWFEEIVYFNLKRVNISGLKSQKNGIGIGSKRIDIPQEVGEIDFIGYSPSENLLVIAECKLVRSGAEPKLFRDDIQDFITGKKSYLKKFEKKVAWVKTNLVTVCTALESTGACNPPVKPSPIKTVIITHYPSIVQCLIKDHPCVSIANFMADYEKAGRWPY